MIPKSVKRFSDKIMRKTNGLEQDSRPAPAARQNTPKPNGPMPNATPGR
jgi:hypothetical protein